MFFVALLCLRFVHTRGGPFFRFALAFSDRMRYNIPETQKHKGRAQGMAVPRAPMQETLLLHNSLHTAPALIIPGKPPIDKGRFPRACVCVICGVGFSVPRRFCLRRGRSAPPPPGGRPGKLFILWR